MTIYNRPPELSIRAAVLDFDGTLSTLRCGWETVMRPLMVEYIAGDTRDAETLDKISREVDRYIDESTGIQTIGQMKWLRDAILRYGLNKGAPDDIWFYKGEYNRRLMETVTLRRESVSDGISPREDYMVGGAEGFLKLLKRRSVELFAASGTDTDDVRAEAALLGLDGYFTSIEGARPHSENCSKETVIASLLKRGAGHGILTCGDGKVEIRLGREAGALTLGIASDEEKRFGFNPVKAQRLKNAGADAIAGDFSELSELESFIFG